MWRLIYTILLHALLPFFLAFALFKQKIRKNLKERLFPKGPENGRNLFWIHAASLGEAVIAENIIRPLLLRNRDLSFLVTTNTYYTRDLLRRRFGTETQVHSLPFDLPFSLRLFFKNSSFTALLLVETEIWPNLIWMAHSRHIPVIIVNGRISDSTFRHYRFFSFFFRRVFSSVNLIIAQSTQQAERFIQAGAVPSTVIALGNLKYAREVGVSEETPAKEKSITFGSVKEKELEILVPVIERLKQAYPDYRIFVAPRELRIVDRLERAFSAGFRVARFSSCKDGEPTDAELIIVDTVGDLLGLYSKSMVAFVGGSLAPYGGQNMLEPLFFATPVLFGPYTDNFREIAEEILSSGAGLVVTGADDLYEGIIHILRDDAVRQSMGRAGLAVVQKQRDVLDKAIDHIWENIWKNSQNSSN